MKRYFGILIVCLLIVSSISIGNIAGNEKDDEKADTSTTSHKITQEEVEKLKELEGVYQEDMNYNVIIDGHGTGLRPPTEEEWNAMIGKVDVIDRIQSSRDAASTSVDNSATIWFPPIGNQDGEGSCTCFAVGYYVKTFQEAKDHNWDLSDASWEGGYSGHPTPAYQDKIMSPDFIYHQINGGVDGGSSFYDAINLVCNIGISSWEKMPYDPADHTTWPSESAWREAPLYRGEGYSYAWVTDDTGIQNLKNLLAYENLALIAIDASKYSNLIDHSDSDLWTVDTYIPSELNHANTIVGYDDNFGPYTEEGETRYGAFKVANSWGTGWGGDHDNDGFYWISYEAMKQRVQYYWFYYDKIDYDPETIAVFEMSHDKRNECDITVGKGSTSSPIKTKEFAPSWDGGDHPFPTNKMVLDITEFEMAGEDLFIAVCDGGSSTTGSLDSFAVEFYTTYDPSGAADRTITSPDPPVSTIQGGCINAVCSNPAPAIGKVSAMPKSLSPGENVTITAEVVFSGTPDFVWAEIESPDETVITTLDLYDDGLHNDGDADDDVYGNTWTTDGTERTYLVDIIAQDTTPMTTTKDNATMFTTVPCGFPVQVTTDIAYDEYPSIAKAADGKLWVIWDRYGDIYYKTSSDDGATWSDPQLLVETNYYNYKPSIMKASDNTLWLVWIRNGDIYCKTSTDNGSTWSSETVILDDSYYNYRPRISEANGRLWVTYDRYEEDSNVYYIYYDGAWSSPQPLATESGSIREWNGKIVADSTNKLYGVYQREGDIYYKTSTDNGVTWSSPIQIT
ncbi:MAG: hypothetical protein DRO67_05635, partial [Candidatus Asgardarchaeum californiense]